MKNKAKKVRKVTESKKYPILDKDKRQRLGLSQTQELPNLDTSQIPNTQEDNTNLDLKEYFQQYNE